MTQDNNLALKNIKRDFNSMIDREFTELVYNDKIQHDNIFLYIKKIIFS